MTNWLAKILLKFLKGHHVSGETKTAIVAALLDSSNMLPIKDVVTFDQEGSMYVRGKKLDMEQAILLKDSSISAKNNFAIKLVDEQLTFDAIKMGVHNGLNSELIMFSKVCLWYIQEKNKLLDKMNPFAYEENVV